MKFYRSHDSWLPRPQHHPPAPSVHNPKTALFCLYRLKFKLWTSGVEGEGAICEVLIPCWELISNFTFNQVFLLSFFYCCFFFVLLLLKLFVAPVEGVATHAVWYLQSGAKQIPWKGHKHFSNWLQHFLSTCCCFLVVTAFYFHMPRGPYCCLLPAATPPACPPLLSARLPACLPAAFAAHP